MSSPSASLRDDIELEQTKYEAWAITTLMSCGLPPRHAAREFYDRGMSRWATALGRSVGCIAAIIAAITVFTAATYAAPPGLLISPSASGSVELGWEPSPDPNAAGYNVYFGRTSGVYTDKVNAGNTAALTISGLTGGVTYYFAATTYDAYGQESGFSNEAEYTVPLTTFTLQIDGQAGLPFTVYSATNLAGLWSLFASGIFPATLAVTNNGAQEFFKL